MFAGTVPVAGSRVSEFEEAATMVVVVAVEVVVVVAVGFSVVVDAEGSGGKANSIVEVNGWPASNAGELIEVPMLGPDTRIPFTMTCAVTCWGAGVTANRPSI